MRRRLCLTYVCGVKYSDVWCMNGAKARVLQWYEYIDYESCFYDLLCKKDVEYHHKCVNI